MALQLLREAQARLDKLWKQCDAAYSALEADLSNELKKGRYEAPTISVHETEVTMSSLAATAAKTSGRHAFVCTNTIASL